MMQTTTNRKIEPERGSKEAFDKALVELWMFYYNYKSQSEADSLVKDVRAYAEKAEGKE